MGLIPKVDSCCCVFPLRTGATIAGWWGTITGIINVIIYIWALADPQSYPELKGKTTTITASLVILLIAAILKVLFSGALLFGIYQERPGLFMPWIVFSIVSLIVDIIGYIIIIASGSYVYKVLGQFISTCVFAYFIVVVSSYKKELKQ